RPAGALLLARAPGQQGDLVRHHERRVEADAELADQPLRPGPVLGLLQFAQELGRTGVGDRADELPDLVVGHADAVVPHGEGAGVPVDLELDVQVGDVDAGRLVPQGRQAQLVERVGRVGDELPEEDVLVRVDRVDHQLEQLTGLYLELKRFGRHGARLPHSSRAGHRMWRSHSNKSDRHLGSTSPLPPRPGATAASSSGPSSRATAVSGRTSRSARASRIAPSSELIIRVASGAARSGGPPISVSAPATASVHRVKAADTASRVDSVSPAQSTVAAATGQPPAKPADAYSSVHCRTISANSPAGVGSGSAARKRSTRSAAYRPAQPTASLTSCSLPPGK